MRFSIQLIIYIALSYCADVIPDTQNPENPSDLSSIIRRKRKIPDFPSQSSTHSSSSEVQNGSPLEQEYPEQESSSDFKDKNLVN